MLARLENDCRNKFCLTTGEVPVKQQVLRIRPMGSVLALAWELESTPEWAFQSASV
jgi:hypothetical protein